MKNFSPSLYKLQPTNKKKHKNKNFEIKRMDIDNLTCRTPFLAAMRPRPR